jgi:hypothetical protein
MIFYFRIFSPKDDHSTILTHHSFEALKSRDGVLPSLAPDGRRLTSGERKPRRTLSPRGETVAQATVQPCERLQQVQKCGQAFKLQLSDSRVRRSREASLAGAQRCLDKGGNCCENEQRHDILPCLPVPGHISDTPQCEPEATRRNLYRFGTGPIRLMMLSLRRAYLRAESGGGHLAAPADQIDYWIRWHLVPCPPERNVNPARERLVALTAIGKTLRDQYDAVAAPAPRHLATLVEQLQRQH